MTATPIKKLLKTVFLFERGLFVVPMEISAVGMYIIRTLSRGHGRKLALTAGQEQIKQRGGLFY